MHGGVLFNSRFAAMWRMDEYRDYLSPAKVKKAEARDVLSRLLAGGLMLDDDDEGLTLEDGDEEEDSDVNDVGDDERSSHYDEGNGETSDAFATNKSELSGMMRRHPSITDVFDRTSM